VQKRTWSCVRFPLLLSHRNPNWRRAPRFRNISQYQRYGPVGCNAVQFVDTPTFRRNISTLSTRSKRKGKQDTGRMRQKAELNICMRPPSWICRDVVPPAVCALNPLPLILVPSTLRIRVRHNLCRQPYGNKLLCKYA
jgi:hypothetical protein